MRSPSWSRWSWPASAGGGGRAPWLCHGRDAGRRGTGGAALRPRGAGRADRLADLRQRRRLARGTAAARARRRSVGRGGRGDRAARRGVPALRPAAGRCAAGARPAPPGAPGRAHGRQPGDPPVPGRRVRPGRPPTRRAGGAAACEDQGRGPGRSRAAAGAGPGAPSRGRPRLPGRQRHLVGRGGRADRGRTGRCGLGRGAAPAPFLGRARPAAAGHRTARHARRVLYRARRPADRRRERRRQPHQRTTVQVRRVPGRGPPGAARGGARPRLPARSARRRGGTAVGGRTHPGHHLGHVADGRGGAGGRVVPHAPDPAGVRRRPVAAPGRTLAGPGTGIEPTGELLRHTRCLATWEPDGEWRRSA